MTYHPRLSEQLAVVGRIKPQAITKAATATSDIVDMKYHARLMVLVNIGEYAAGNDGSVAVALYSDSASNMATEAAITGKALTTGSFTGSAAVCAAEDHAEQPEPDGRGDSSGGPQPLRQGERL